MVRVYLLRLLRFYQAYCTLLVHCRYCNCYVTGGVWICFQISRSTSISIATACIYNEIHWLATLQINWIGGGMCTVTCTSIWIITIMHGDYYYSSRMQQSVSEQCLSSVESNEQLSLTLPGQYHHILLFHYSN